MGVIIGGKIYFEISIYIECWLIIAKTWIIEPVSAVKYSRMWQ
jgi:hypothetical protein